MINLFPMFEGWNDTLNYGSVIRAKREVADVNNVTIGTEEC